MSDFNVFLDELAGLLADNAIGLDRLAARPRGNRLSQEIRDSIEAALDQLDQVQPDWSTGGVVGDRASRLIYGNSCFSVRRFETAVETYQRLLRSDAADTSAAFNSVVRTS